MAEAQGSANGSDAKGAESAAANAGNATSTDATKTTETSLLGTAEGAKPADAKPAGSAEAAKPEAAKAAPAEIELKLPEGFDAKDETVGKFKELAKGAGLDSKGAQALFDLHAQAIAKAQAPVQQALKEYEAARAGWVASLKADPEIGGAKFESSVGSARRAIQFAGGDALRSALEESGYGDHPALVKAFAKLGALIKEDGIQSDGEGGASAKPPIKSFEDLAKSLYG